MGNWNRLGFAVVMVAAALAVIRSENARERATDARAETQELRRDVNVLLRVIEIPVTVPVTVRTQNGKSTRKLVVRRKVVRTFSESQANDPQVPRLTQRPQRPLTAKAPVARPKTPVTVKRKVSPRAVPKAPAKSATAPVSPAAFPAAPAPVIQLPGQSENRSENASPSPGAPSPNANPNASGKTK